jgi:hypothetical protein
MRHPPCDWACATTVGRSPPSSRRPAPLEALAAARELRLAAEALELELVLELRERRWTWSEIGKVYGTSKQGAQQRFRSVAEHRAHT